MAERLTQRDYERYCGLVLSHFSGTADVPLAYLHSFGCQQNVSDGERILGMLSEMGYGFTDDISSAALIIYNTCAVRETAEEKVFGIIGELKALKRKNPDIIIAICGCMVQQEHIVERIRKSYKQVDIIFGTFAARNLPKLIWQVISERRTVWDISEDGSSLIPEGIDGVRAERFRAYVPIMYGCNNFCSYCIVPYVRGRERSRKSEDIISEVKRLVSDGVKEIMLLGQNVNSYGRGLEEKIDFSALLEKINDVEGEFRIRFMSSHPKDASEKLIDTIIRCEKVCKHLHLPIQSGSDRILAEMNRHYTAEQYMKIVNYAREKIPDFSFTTDIIVGFPNETDEDFRRTLAVMEEVKYDNIFSFIYSKRTGTKAALIEDGITEEEKGLRMRELLAVQRRISDEHMRRFVGRTLTVLADSESKTQGMLSGKSFEFIIVEFEAEKALIGSLVRVEITGAKSWALTGRLIQ